MCMRLPSVQRGVTPQREVRAVPSGASVHPGDSTKAAEGLDSSYPRFPLPFCAHAIRSLPSLLVISACPY